MTGLDGTEVGNVVLRRCATNPALAVRHLEIWTEQMRRHQHNDECGGCSEVLRVISELEKLVAAQRQEQEMFR